MGMPSGIVARGASGQITGTQGLTVQQRAFVNAYVKNGGNLTEAATVAGYAEPRVYGWQLVRLAHIQAAIHQARSVDISELAVLGLGRVRSILGAAELLDNAAGARVVLDAAKFVVNLAGHVPPKAAETDDDGLDKPMHEMTIAELEAFILRGEEAVRRAKAPVIEGQAVQVDAPVDAPEAGDGDVKA